MSTTLREHNSPLNLLLGGLLTVWFGTAAVLMAIGLGWVAAALLGPVLIFLGWRARAASLPTVMTYLLVGLGTLSLFGAGFDLLT